MEYLEIGGYYPMDDAGHVLNRADAGHLQGDWLDLAEAVAAAYRERHGERLAAVCLRGSVVAGSAVPGVSDLDAFAVLHWREGERWQRWEEAEWSRSVRLELQARHPVASRVEMAECSWEGGDFGHSPRVRDMVATQGLCIWGRDLPRTLPPPHISALKRNGDWLEADWKAFLKAEGEEARQQAGRTFAKTIIRAAFEAYMEAAGKYATDLHPCIEVAAAYRPEWKADLRRLATIFAFPQNQLEEMEEIGRRLLPQVLER